MTEWCSVSVTWQRGHTACPAQQAPHQGLKGQYKADDEGVHILDQIIEACVSCSSQGRTPTQLITIIDAQQLDLTQPLQCGRLDCLEQRGRLGSLCAARSPTMPGMMAR